MRGARGAIKEIKKLSSQLESRVLQMIFFLYSRALLYWYDEPFEI
jgi:hypothetical protein